MGWERKHIVLLIDLYQKEPVLYYTTHKDYRNRYKREAAWNRILEAVSEQRPNTGVRDIRDKIENLRTVYALQKRKVENSIKKNNKNGKTYVPTVWYYPHLSFLNEHLQPRKNKNEIDGDDLDCDILNSNGYEVIVKNFLKHKNENLQSTAKDFDKRTNKSKKRKNQKNTNDEKTGLESVDKYSLFGAYVADRLRCIGTETSHKLEDDILRIVMEAERRKCSTAKTMC